MDITRGVGGRKGHRWFGPRGRTGTVVERPMTPLLLVTRPGLSAADIKMPEHDHETALVLVLVTCTTQCLSCSSSIRF